MSSRGESQHTTNNRPQSSNRGRGVNNIITGNKKRGGVNNVHDIQPQTDRGRGTSSRGRPYKRESLVAKPTVLIKGTPTILGAKQITPEQAEPAPEQQIKPNNAPPQVVILSPNNTNASVSTKQIETSPVKRAPPPVPRSLQTQQIESVIANTAVTPTKVSVPFLNKTTNPQAHMQPVQAKPIAPPNKSLKLMTDNLDIMLEQVSKIMSSTTGGEHAANDYTVIGILGEQGVGKSTILNEIARRRGKMEDIFPVENEETLMEARHETNGLDIYVVTEERLILIDTQPLYSSSVLMALIQRGGDHYSNNLTLAPSKLSPDVMSFENHIDLLAIQMGLLLFSICHIVLVVMDDNVGDGSGGDAEGMVTFNGDLKMYRFVQTMRMLQKGVPNNLTEDNSEYVPDVVFVYNRVKSRTIESEFCVKQIGSFLDAYMANTSIRKNGAIYPTLGCSHSESDARVNFFLIPDQSDTHLYNTLTRTFRNALLHMPRTPFSRTISERDWLNNIARIWEIIRKSPFISEYNRSFQKVGLYKTT